MVTINGSDTPPAAVTADVAVSPSPLDSEHLTSIDNQPSTPHSHSPPPQSQIQETLPPCPSHFFNSVTECKDFLEAISSFHQSYESVKFHLDIVKTAVLAKLPSEAHQITQPTPSVSSPIPDVPNDEKELQRLQLEGQIDPEQEFVDLCKTMCNRDVRKYIVTRLSNRPMLRAVVPKALRQAENPPKLVLECMGKFFLQGSKAFIKNSPMIPSREASILILECFLIMLGLDNSGELNIDKAVKEEADDAAIAWRKRLISEGGVAKASQIDARGLLLFIACFGIPALFKLEDIRDIVINANAKEIASVLQKSHVLMSKISETVEDMLKKKTEVDAVDIIYTFGLEQRFNTHSILIPVLRESKDTWKKSKNVPHSSSNTLMQDRANRIHLDTLKSISKCLERHKIDPVKLLPGWQIKEKIVSLEQDLSTPGKNTLPFKRKPTETESSQKAKGQEAKRQRYRGQQHRGGSSNHSDNRRNSILNNYSASQAVMYGGPGAGLLPPHSASIRAPYSGAPHPYAWNGDTPAVDERYYNYRNYSNNSSNTQGGGPPVGVGLTSIYGSVTPAIEGFTVNIVNNGSSLVGGGLGRGGGAVASDLYRFVDTVAETERISSNVATSTMIIPPPSHPSSYLYHV